MIQENAQQVEGWEITSGRHRFEAAWRMNYTTVPSVVVDENVLHAKLAMIAENLHRAELIGTPSGGIQSESFPRTRPGTKIASLTPEAQRSPLNLAWTTTKAPC